MRYEGSLYLPDGGRNRDASRLKHPMGTALELAAKNERFAVESAVRLLQFIQIANNIIPFLRRASGR